MIGTTIGHYRILEKLGEGGMGVVYKSQDMRLNRLVALKFLRQNLVRTETDLARFLQEARTAASLSHANICTIYGIEEDNGDQFIVMEYVDGATLRTKIAGSPLLFPDFLTYASQIGEGLAAAHDRGIVHRDIKPDNIIVNAKNQIKVMDFGLAKLKGDVGLTRTAITLGTAAYMSPEQIQGADVDHRTDIWSFGVVLYEMLTSKLPFRGEHEAAVLYSIVNEDPPPPSSLTSETPPHVDDIILRALEKDTAKRYQTVRELLYDLTQSRSSSHDTRHKSVAVLPFENLSTEKENEFFSDGLTEEIIATLSKIRSIDVVSRTSVMQYKGTTKSIKQISRELQARHLLEGSVRKQGDDLRITAQLIDAQQDVHLWAEKYRGDVHDVFDIQEKVAEQIAHALEIQLSPHEERDLRKRATDDAEAYQSYLKGRYNWNRRTEHAVRRGLTFFKQAIEKDPTYALAYHGLADSYNILGFYSFLPPRETFPLARAAAERALEIDSSLAEAYSSLAYAQHYFDWDWNAAELNYRKAITLKDRYATVHQFFCNYLTSMGRFEEAVAEARRATEIDPLSLIGNSAVGWVYNHWRKYDQAIEQFRRTIEIDGEFMLAHLWLGMSYERKNMFDDAIGEFQRAVQLSGQSTISLAALAHAYARSGNLQGVAGILEQFDKHANEAYVSSYFRAVIEAGSGRIDRAFAFLEKAVEERSHWLVFLNVDSDLDPLRSDPRFEAVLKKVGLPG